MNRILCALVALLMLSATNPSSAAVFERDWKTLGDGLLTYDDVNQRDWLDLSESLLSKFSGATLEDRYQDVITELAPNGMFEGFTVAKRADVSALGLSAGIDLTTDDYPTNHAPMMQLLDLIGPTIVFNDVHDTMRAQGFLGEIFVGHITRRWGSVLLLEKPDIVDGAAGMFFSAAFEPEFPSLFGIMLYRNVPEPASHVVVLVGCAAAVMSRRTRLNNEGARFV
jgi:hypothetical protein